MAFSSFNTLNSVTNARNIPRPKPEGFYYNVISTSNLEFYYTFNYDKTTNLNVVTNWKNGPGAGINDATLNNTYSTSISNTAYVSDTSNNPGSLYIGSTNYATRNTSFTLSNTGYTLSFWLYSSTGYNGTLQNCFGFNSGTSTMHVNIAKTGTKPYIQIFDAGGYTNALDFNGICNGQWNHIVYRINSSNASEIVINTVLWGASTLTYSNVQKNISVARIGYRADSRDTPFQGNIDNVRFYNRELNNGEIATLYNNYSSTGKGY